MTELQERVRLLVVDDDEGMVDTLRDVLVASGYGVDVAYSGREAIERAKIKRPDGILMDVRMPGMNGVDAFREIKRESADSFVIFMSAYAASTMSEDILRQGAVEVVAKPLDLEHILYLIDKTALEMR